MLRKSPLIFRFFNSRKLTDPRRVVKFNNLSNRRLQTSALNVTKRFLNQNEKAVLLRGFIANHNVDVERRCWKCDSGIDYRSLRCRNNECGVIQKPLSEDNYFDVLRANADQGGYARSFRFITRALHWIT